MTDTALVDHPFIQNLAVVKIDLTQTDLTHESSITWKDLYHPIKNKLINGSLVAFTSEGSSPAHRTVEKFKVNIGELKEVIKLLTNEDITFIKNKNTVVKVLLSNICEFKGSRTGKITEALTDFKKCYEIEKARQIAGKEEAVVAAEEVEAQQARAEYEELLRLRAKEKELLARFEVQEDK
ncbi:MAG: hypothetical protein COA90_07915 [Gammaproteobacteria bacterium]|nr:MAG: hypothetical protein COA90_07915 [Gammaproteobacteria bacterium]